MAKSNTKPSAPKNTVSADTQTSKQEVSNNKTLALPVEPKNLEVLRQLTKQYPWSTPRDIFYFMFGKDICSPEMLKEMFALDDKFLPLVFDEWRDVYCEENVRWILEHNILLDENDEEVSISLSPAQQKLRKLLLKIVIVSRYENLTGALYDEYGINYYEYDEVVEENNTITEEELLDALQTYQEEHRA